jgi:uncharacterized protein
MQVIGAALGVYLLLIGAVFVMQRTLLYPGAREAPDLGQYAGLGIEEVTTRTADGLTLTHWYRPPDSPEGPVVVVFQGNAGHLGDRVPKLKPLIDAGFGLLFVGYRGYSGNPGSPTEDDLTADAGGLLDWLLEQGVGLERTVLYGESLGSGVAVKMALERRVAAVVLESPYTSIAEVSQVHYWYLPARWLILDKWDSLSRIARISAPLLVLHGDKDTVVPLRFGQALFEAAQEPKEMIVIAGAGHVDLLDYTRVVDRVLAFVREQVR